MLVHPRLLERLWLLPRCCCFDGSVVFTLPKKYCTLTENTARQQRSSTRADMKRMPSAVLGPDMSQWHSARNCSNGAVRRAESRLTGRFWLSISPCLSVSGHLHTPACGDIGGAEICENTPGTRQPITAMIRLSSDWWVTDGRVKMARKCAAFQWWCLSSTVLILTLTGWDTMWDCVMGYSH